MGAGSVGARLATLFMQLADRFGTREPGSTHAILTLPLTRSTLAGFVEARVETVIRTLSRWRRDGVLDTTAEGFDVDCVAMAAISAAG